MSRRHQQPSLPIVSVRPEPTAAAAAGCRPCSECPVPLSQQHQRVVALPSQSNPTVSRAGTVVLIWNQQLDELFVSVRFRQPVVGLPSGSLLRYIRCAASLAAVRLGE